MHSQYRLPEIDLKDVDGHLDELQYRSQILPSMRYLLFKRVFDILFSATVIVLVLSWMFPLVALLIKLSSRGSVLFLQKREGQKGEIFWCIKFRTMKENPEADEKQAEENDERITKLGSFLRKTNIDELPQFVNVLFGDMSVVGPRPHMITDCERFSSAITGYHLRNIMRPGITGLAQIRGYHGITRNYQSVLKRYEYDMGYIRTASFGLDMRIIFATVVRVIFNLAAY